MEIYSNINSYNSFILLSKNIGVFILIKEGFRKINRV